MFQQLKTHINAPAISNEVKEVAERLNTRELYTILLILVVGFGSFGLGRLSKLREGKMPIRVEQAGATAVALVSPLLSREGTEGNAASSIVKDKGLAIKDSGALAPSGQYVASKSGTKYYFPWCGSAARISEANKIWFNSVEEARKAGYTPAANCKGLR